MTRTKERLDVCVRWMIRRDLPRVLEIDRLSFQFPWLEADFLDQLRKRNCIAMVAELDDTQRLSPGLPLGFIVYELAKSHLNLLRMAVHPWFRRRGVGTALIGRLAQKLRQQRRNRIATFVLETNLPAQLFLQRQGFLAGEILRGCCEVTGRDAYLFELFAD